MNDGSISIVEEINEELKNDRQLEFLKKHKRIIFVTIVVSLVAIIAYLSWYERKKKSMEEATNAIFNVILDRSSKNDLIISEIINDAPAELKPILLIIKHGNHISLGDLSEASFKSLFDLSQKSGVDLIWKDLALLIYASYPTKTSAELVKLLEPLTADDRPFRFTALEIISMINKNDGKIAEALNCLEKILQNKEAPQTLRKRCEILYNHIRHGVEDN